jgi:hypothetical protein
MLDDLNSGPSPVRGKRDGLKDGQKPRSDRDREVHSIVERDGAPMQSERVLAAAVHEWLDGELPEAAVRKGDTARDVEFWRGLTDQLERSRRMRTPAHVEAQIMAAIPHHAPQLITPWYEREFVITPMAAVGAAAGIIAVTAAVTVALVGP